MKKLLMNFATNLLSKQQMKEVKGGGSYKCLCGDSSQEIPGCITAWDKYTVQCGCWGGVVVNC
jgi:natural product precursor